MLPTINLPKYDLTLPGCGKKIKYRPFVVKEQKIMLMAVEMDEAGQLSNAIKDILTSCTFNEVDIDALPVYDVDYLMLNIRRHSVGDVLELKYKCNNLIEGKVCSGTMGAFLNLSDVNVDFPETHEYIYKLSDNMGMKFKDLTYSIHQKLVKLDPSSITSSNETIMNCIESIYEGEDVFLAKDYSYEDLTTWVDTLSIDDYEAIETFLDTMPKLQHKLELKCPKCGHKHTTTLVGIDDFLD